MPPLDYFLFISSFVAGMLMFLAPCTLPLLPAYLGFISGVTENELLQAETKKKARRKVLRNSFMFTLGFSTVLVLSGTTAGFLGSLTNSFFGGVIKNIGGVLIILFGLFMIGTIRASFLHKERRLKLPAWITVGKPISALLLGAAFAIGWTPCVGPVYGTILLYASDSQTIFTGALLLLTFAAGFSVPLLLFAVLISQATRVVEKATPYLGAISFAGGVFLILLGINLLFGHTMLTNWLYSAITYFDFEAFLMPYL
jgi:cytochrome c-type biogenesis protein